MNQALSGDAKCFFIGGTKKVRKSGCRRERSKAAHDLKPARVRLQEDALAIELRGQRVQMRRSPPQPGALSNGPALIAKRLTSGSL
ncbi:MAG: hypothetical protein ABIQ60_10845, partial [Burkholderiaceae bacterium]